MKWTPLFLVAVVLLVAAAQSPSPSIGVVDVNQLFENYHKTNQLDAKLVETSQQFGAGIKALEERIEKLRGEQSLLEKGTDRYRESEKKLFSWVQEHKFEVNRAKQAIQEKQKEFRDQILEELRRAVDDYGRSHGFSLILQKELSATEGKGWRSVLYNAEGVDITAQILKQVNPRDD